MFAIGKRSFISRAYKEKALQINDSQSLIEYSKRDLNPHSRNGQRILSPSCLPFHHSSILKREKRAENETRTRDPNLGKVMLYQLSYFRIRRTGAKINSFPVSAKFFFIKVQYSQRDLNPQNLLPAQQLFLRSLHGLKIETIYHFLHQGRDFIVAKVSDTAFGDADQLRGCDGSGTAYGLYRGRRCGDSE